MATDSRPVELRFHSLEAAVLKLTTNVNRLVEALNTVATLSTAQQKQAERQSASEVQAKEAHDTAQARYRRITRVQRLIVVIIIIIVPTASLLAYWTLTVQVNQKFTEEQNGSAANCQLRNKSNVEIPQARELLLTAVYKARKDPVMEKIHQDSANALAKSAVDCSIYKHKLN